MKSAPRQGGRRPVVVALAAFALLLGGCSADGGSGATTSPPTTAGSSSTGSSSSSASTSPSTSTTSTEPTPEGVSVAEIFGAARTTAQAATSGRVRGTVTSDEGRVGIDLAGRTDGTNQTLRLTTSEGTLTVLTVAGKYYLVAGKDFWKKNAGDAAAAQLAGKYVLMSEEDASSFGSFTLGALVDEMFSDSELSPLDQIRTTVTATTQAGEQVYVLTDRLSDTGKVVVTADGKAELRSIQVGGASPGSLSFGQWNAVPPIKAPAPKDVVKL